MSVKGPEETPLITFKQGRWRRVDFGSRVLTLTPDRISGGFPNVPDDVFFWVPLPYQIPFPGIYLTLSLSHSLTLSHSLSRKVLFGPSVLFPNQHLLSDMFVYNVHTPSKTFALPYKGQHNGSFE